MESARILIIDDNEDLAETMGMVLTACGHEVDSRYDANSARKILREREYDVVLIDLKLPDGNGIDIYEEIVRDSPRTTRLICTAFRLDGVIEMFTGINHATIAHAPLIDTVDSLAALARGQVVVALEGAANDAAALCAALGETGRECLCWDSGDPVLERTALADADLVVISTDETVVEALMSVRPEAGLFPAAVFLLRSPASSQHHASWSARPELTGCLFKPYDPAGVIELLEALGN